MHQRRAGRARAPEARQLISRPDRERDSTGRRPVDQHADEGRACHRFRQPFSVQKRHVAEYAEREAADREQHAYLAVHDPCHRGERAGAIEARPGTEDEAAEDRDVGQTPAAQFCGFRRHQPEEGQRHHQDPDRRFRDAEEHVAGARRGELRDRPHRAYARAMGRKSEYGREKAGNDESDHCIGSQILSGAGADDSMPLTCAEATRTHVVLAV